MTYGSLKRRVMELVFSYSIAGTPLPAAYNNQADYTGMIPGLVNQAQMDIATNAKRIYESVPLTELERTEINGRIRYKMPENCWSPLTSGLLLSMKYRCDRVPVIRMYGGKFIEVPPVTAETLVLEYWRYPDTVSEVTPDDTELDNTPDVHECLVYYVAAQLLLYDDAYRHTVLMNQYELMKSRLKEPEWMEIRPIFNQYQV